MKLYDLSYSLFFSHFLLNFVSGFFEVKIAKLLVAVGLNWGPMLFDPRLLHNHFYSFFIFFLVRRFTIRTNDLLV